MRRQNQCFTRVLQSERTYETSKSTFYTVLPLELIYETSKPMFYMCFTIRTKHLKHEDERFRRVLQSESNIQDVKMSYFSRFLGF